MPRFSANLSFLFPELPFLERFDAAAKAGFKGVEFLDVYEFPMDEVGDRAAMAETKVVTFNAPCGDRAKGERGLAALRGRETDFHASIQKALEWADFLECDLIHVMAGIIPDEDEYGRAFDTYVANLRYAAREAREWDKTVVICPINDEDLPDYFLTRPDDALLVIEEADHPNLKLQLDLYHAQRTQGALSDLIEGNRENIAHIQIAGVPFREEPDDGEVNFPFLYSLLDADGYDGWVGCKYNPRGDTLRGLKWGKEFGLG